MLCADAVLTESLVQRIRHLNYSGLYIKDEFSEGIVPVDVISEELRTNTVRAIHRFMLDMESPGGGVRGQDNMGDILALIERIIDEISDSDGTLINLIDLKSFDLYTYQHSVNVCVLSCVMAAAHGFKREQLYDLAIAAILHDIGKVFIPKDILNKPAKLTPDEYKTVKKHPADGCDHIRKKFHFNNTVCMPVRQHHERYDGNGYPQSLSEAEIFTASCIISIADVYDAITSKRPYHEAIMPSEAYEYIMGNTGSHFNPDAVGVFVRTVAPFPVGVSVRLSNGLEGLVFENDTNFPMRPLIKIKTEPGEPEHFIDLCNDKDALDITIQQILQ